MRIAAWSGLGRRPGKLFFQTPRTSLRARPPLSAGRSGSEFSLGDVLQHVDVEGLVRDDALQSAVLNLELLQPLGV